MRLLDSCSQTAVAAERYIEAHLFDHAGLMYSGIDAQTDTPFEKVFITPRKVPRRAAADPWAYWTYEDSMMSMGLYLDGLTLKYQVTGAAECLSVAQRVWSSIRNVYACSQVHGIGSFLRPYGGFEVMHRFLEPLGTDQASPLFSGLYRYLPHASQAEAEAMRRVMRQTLEWYEQQGFEYFYYKSFIHPYTPGNPIADHANSYYLPALAWAARTFPEDARWPRCLGERLGYFTTGGYPLYARGSHQPTFCWGSDFIILHELLGPRFDEVFTPAILDDAYSAVNEVLDRYTEPGMVLRVCPESAEPGFHPSVDPNFDPEQGMGFAYFSTRHHGRRRPRHEIDFLLALASIGYRREEIAARAAGLLSLWHDVPDDFTAFLAEDYELLPDTVHLYARSIGVNLVCWWRNYWLLRNIDVSVASCGTDH